MGGTASVIGDRASAKVAGVHEPQRHEHLVRGGGVRDDSNNAATAAVRKHFGGEPAQQIDP